MSFLINLGIIFGIYVILGVSLQLALGYTGLLNLGHIAFFAIGAYTSALLTEIGVPFFLGFILAGLFASIFGYILVKITDKLKGDYLALATLAFHFVVISILVNWRSLTKGPIGIPGIDAPNFFGMSIARGIPYLIFVGIIAVLVVFLVYRIVKSPFGRCLQGTRDDELALRVLGKNTFLLKAKAMMVSSFFAGIAGSLFAHYITFIDPSVFSLDEIILVLTIVILGGLASIRGTIIGAFIVVLLPELLRFLSLPSSVLGPVRQILYALLIIGIMMFRPRGIFGKVDLE